MMNGKYSSRQVAKTLYTVGNTWSTEYRQDSLSKKGGYYMLQATGDEQKQWRVGADGDLKKIGDTWKLKMEHPAEFYTPDSVQDDPGFILAVSPSGDTVVMDGDAYEILWACRTDKATGQILPPGEPLSLTNLGGYAKYCFVSHPRHPFVFVGKQYVPTTQYSVYQWGAAGELKRIGDFAPLLGAKRRGTLFADPSGRFLVEWGTTSVATHRTDKTGAVTPARSAKPLPGETGAAILLVAPPVP